MTPIINSTISTMIMVYNIGDLLSVIVEGAVSFYDPIYIEVFAGLYDP
jgi:hypothetical protein